jgi:hypothetical protein
MYKHNQKQLEFPDFHLPFGGHLDPDNRWVRWQQIIPWEQFEELYCSSLSDSGQGPPALSVQMALGALIIKEKLGVSDEECVQQICENPYLQYFCGMKKFKTEIPFDPTMFVYFRKRFPHDVLNKINEVIVENAISSSNSDKDIDPPGSNTSDKSEPTNKGKLLVDATCAPADITYPTDLKLLNKAREKSEKVIDTLHESRGKGHKKPRTYRKKARKQFLAIAKSKKVRGKKLRKGLRSQLGYLRRNLKSIAKLSQETDLSTLNHRQYRELLVLSEVYRQQRWMYDNQSKRIDDRIVSISQPHVRPIKRGKAGSDTEFGAKLSVSLVNGYSFVDRISWDNFNEGPDLIDQIEKYKQRYGFYPESVHADKIYRNRDNLRFCKKNGIRLSGPRLGRPPNITEENVALIRIEAKQSRQDELDRIPIEGKFGQGKRGYGLGRIMTKLPGTSETAIILSFLVMNLEKWLAAILHFLIFKEQRSVFKWLFYDFRIFFPENPYIKIRFA